MACAQPLDGPSDWHNQRFITAAEGGHGRARLSQDIWCRHFIDRAGQTPQQIFGAAGFIV